MKLSVSFLLVLPALVAAAVSPLEARGDIYMPYQPHVHARQFGRQRQRQGGFKSGQNGFNRGQNRGGAGKGAVSSSAAATASSSAANKGGKGAAASSTSTSAAAANNKGGKGGAASSTSAVVAASGTSSAAAAASSSAAAKGNGGNNGANNSDPNTSLNLLPELVATGLAQDGQATPEAGQVPSLTSKNNFINYCAGKTITNGQQITTGSCNPIPMGDIIPKANMPTCKFSNPKNQDVIPANKPFTITMNVVNMQAGVFTNAQKTYYMAPQQLNGGGVLIGHTHFVVQKMGDFADGTILDPATFAFFKGVNTAAQGGVLSADVTAGLPAGNYRLASINTDSNHAPAIGAVAQHGSFDDHVYFTCK